MNDSNQVFDIFASAQDNYNSDDENVPELVSVEDNNYFHDPDFIESEISDEDIPELIDLQPLVATSETLKVVQSKCSSLNKKKTDLLQNNVFDSTSDSEILLRRGYDPKPYECFECGESFEKKYLLNAHMTTHMEGMVQCDVCKKTCLNKKVSFFIYLIDK